MSRPRAVLFGLGGTLVEAREEPGRAIASRLGLDPDAARRIAAIANGATFDTPSALTARLRSELGLAGDPTAAVEAAWAADSAEPAVIPGAPECVGAVHAAGARVAVVADAWTPFADAARTACVPFATAIDRWFLSSEVGAFAAGGTLLGTVLATLEVAPADVLVVGADLERDLRPALALGASGVWLRQDAGGAVAVTIDPHGSGVLDPHGSAVLDPHGGTAPAAVVPDSAVVARTHRDVRRIALTWLWATRGGRVDLTAPLPA